MKLLPILAILFLFYTNSFAQPSANADFAKANELLEQTVKNKDFVGVVAGFSVDGKSVWKAPAGLSNLQTKKAMETKTIMRIASIAKPMTAIAIMQLYEQGKIDLDKPIQTYLPDFPKKNEGEITVRNLLNHTSGIGGYKNKESGNKIHYENLTDAATVFQDRKLEQTPGTTFSYTTYGYVVLGLIIEKVSGETYETYMSENVWEKAKMVNTGVEDIRQTMPNKTEFYHKKSKKKIKKGKLNDLSNRVPGGGLYSTLEDLLRFGRAVINHDLVKESTLKMMLEKPDVQNDGNPYGLGWTLYGNNSKYGNVFGHAGEQTGAAAQLMILPDVNTVVVVIGNTSGSWKSAVNLSIQLFAEANKK